MGKLYMSEFLYIVDVFSLVFQVYHAIPPMTGPSGQPTNAVFGFTRDLLNLLTQKHATHLICAMDSAGPGERHGLYAEYKANRAEMPADLQPQIPMVVDVMRGFGIPTIEHAGWEADDVIATLTRKAAEAGFEVHIVTNDKDARQLLGPRVKLYNVRKDSLFDEQALADAWCIRPDQVIDFQSLVGDSVDNVPGVPLVGPKKAAALLQQFGSLDEVLAHAEEAPGKKLRENLKTYADQARISRELVTLNQNLPLEFDPDQSRIDPPDVEQLTELFRQFGFRRFIDEVRKLAPQASQPQSAPDTDPPAPADPVVPAKPKRQSSLFPGEPRTWEIIDTLEKFAAFREGLQRQRQFCLDLETTGLDPVRADIVGWAFSWKPHSAYYLPIRGPVGQATLEHETVVEALRPILESPDVEISNQNIKYDLLVLRRAGITVKGLGVDPMVGSYLLDSGARSHGLDALAQKYLNHCMIPITDLIGTGKNQRPLAEIDVARVAEYASEDADVACRLVPLISDELRNENLWDLYWDLERPLIGVLADMEFAGVKVDVDELKRQSDELSHRLRELIDEIHQEAGGEFNIDSPLQLRKILFDKLGLPVMKRTKTGPSTDQGVLEKLALLHPLPAKITEHRQLSKLKGTYLDALPALVNPETGKLHASFNQVVAATGRLSSSNPNLQNIPIRTEAGRRIRKAFQPSQPGWKLVCADYSQIELRMLAHFSDDAALTDAFAHGADIHTAVASEIFGVEEVTSEMRRIAKAVNFGVIYGQSPFGLSAAIGISQDDAAAFIDGYFARYSGVDRFLEDTLDTCLRTGYATTILGRRRAIDGIRKFRPRQRNMPERTAVNSVIQGSAADLIKRAMINVHKRLGREGRPGRMLLQIHDELVFEVPAEEVDSLIEIVRSEMEHAMDLKVPLVVDVSVGDNWLEIEDR